MRQGGWTALAGVLALAGCFGNRGPHDNTDGRPDASSGAPDGDVVADAAASDAATDAAVDAPADAPPSPDAPDAAPVCIPGSCSDRGASCGTGVDDGCGGTLMCGMCEAIATCGGQGAPNVCAIPPATQECANGWCWESPLPFAFTPTQVFARTTSDVWMIGTRGVIKHFDGTSWSAVSSNTAADLHGIWMASATDGWIVGDAGTLLRWNGTAWTKVATGTTNELHGVHGTSATNVWIVGDRVTRRWNGGSWSNVGTTTRFLTNVFVTSNNKVFGTSGALVYENVAGTWTPRTSDTSGILSYPYFNAIAGAGTTVYAVGGVTVIGGDDYEWVWTWDGTTWTQVQQPGQPIYDAAFVDGGVVYAQSGSQIWNTATNAMTSGPPNVSMYGAAGTGGEVFAASSQGRPWRYQTGTWTAPPQADINTRTLSLFGAHRVGDAMWFGRYGSVVEWSDGLIVHDRPDFIDWVSGTGRDNVWALDRDSFDQLATVDHFDGERWTELAGPGVRTETIHATATEVLVFGAGVFRLEGTSWVAEIMPAAATWSSYSAVGADVYLVGMDYTTNPDTPRLARRQAGTWTLLAAPPTQTVCGIAAVSATDIWVTGRDRDPMTFDYSATISHWNGVSWTVTRPANTTDACAIVAAGGQVWVGGTETGAILHRATNGTWSTINGTASGDIRGLAVDANGTLWAAGDDGVIMHR